MKQCLRCGTLVARGSYCPACMPRNGSSRSWRVLRLIVLQRDQFRCQLQLEGCTGEATHVDHVVPVIHGGSDKLENLVASCSNCNLQKGAR